MASGEETTTIEVFVVDANTIHDMKRELKVRNHRSVVRELVDNWKATRGKKASQVEATEA